MSRTIGHSLALIGFVGTGSAIVLPWAQYGGIDVDLFRFPLWGLYIAAAIALQAVVLWRLVRDDRCGGRGDFRLRQRVHILRSDRADGHPEAGCRRAVGSPGSDLQHRCSRRTASCPRPGYHGIGRRLTPVGLRPRRARGESARHKPRI